MTRPTPVPGRSPEQNAERDAERDPERGAAFEALARVDDLLDRVPLAVTTAAGRPVCLVRAGDAVYAVADRCPHQEFPMSAGEVAPDGTFTCVWHGAAFDLATGAVKRGPAADGLETYEVRVRAGVVEVRVR